MPFWTHLLTPRTAAVAVGTTAVLALSVSPAAALHCSQVSKNPDAAEAAPKASNAQEAGRSWNSGFTGAYLEDDGVVMFGRNLLVNASCGTNDHGVLLNDEGCFAGELNPGALYQEFGIAGGGHD